MTLTGAHYRLQPAPDGATRLTREVSWCRHLAPGFYFGWRQDTIMRRGQYRLLELLKQQVPPSEPADVARPAVAVLPGHSRL